ncbi:uncharacterized protein LOC142327519 isoform X2 [Lycorma delicatula]
MDINIQPQQNPNDENEALLQQIHNYRKKVNSLEFVVCELKEDNDLLQKEKRDATELVEEERAIINKLKVQIKKLENNVEELNCQCEKYQEAAEKEKLENNIISVVECKEKEEDIELLLQLNDYKQKSESLQLDLNTLKEINDIKLIKLEEKIKCLQSELVENKDLLNIKTLQLQEANDLIESLKEEKLLLSSELAAVKSNPADSDTRGNSLFAEVEDKRKQMSATLKTVYGKYMQLKKTYMEKSNECKRLKDEFVKLQRRWYDVKQLKTDADARLITAQKAQILELKSIIEKLEKRPESPQFVTLEGSTNLSWVHGVVEAARTEADEMRKKVNYCLLSQWMLEEKLHETTSSLVQVREKMMDLEAENAKYKLQENSQGNNDKDTTSTNTISTEYDNKENILNDVNACDIKDKDNVSKPSQKAVHF